MTNLVETTPQGCELSLDHASRLCACNRPHATARLFQLWKQTLLVKRRLHGVVIQLCPTKLWGTVQDMGFAPYLLVLFAKPFPVAPRVFRSEQHHMHHGTFSFAVCKEFPNCECVWSKCQRRAQRSALENDLAEQASA